MFTIICMFRIERIRRSKSQGNEEIHEQNLTALTLSQELSVDDPRSIWLAYVFRNVIYANAIFYEHAH